MSLTFVLKMIWEFSVSASDPKEPEKPKEEKTYMAFSNI